MDRQPDLMVVGEADGGPRILAHFLEDGKKNGRDRGDNADDDEHFDQRKAAPGAGEETKFHGILGFLVCLQTFLLDGSCQAVAAGFRV